MHQADSVRADNISVIYALTKFVPEYRKVAVRDFHPNPVYIEYILSW